MTDLTTLDMPDGLTIDIDESRLYYLPMSTPAGLLEALEEL